MRYCVLLFVFSIILFPAITNAGSSLYLSPEKGIYSVGDIFDVKILVDSGGEAINAAEADIFFDSENIFVEDLSTEGSVFNMWTIPPSVSNKAGKIEFAGGTRQNFIGEEGLVLTITFKALRSVNSRARFAAAAILSADGTGTNIITEMKSGVYTLKPKEIFEPAEKVDYSNVLPAVPVFSPTHPDSDKWYVEKTAKFSWQLPPDATAIRSLVDKNAESIPYVFYDPPIDEEVVNDLSNGTHYFHLQVKNKAGWSQVSHFKFNIDDENPESFEIVEQKQPTLSDDRKAFLFESFDKISGIEKYEIVIDNNDSEIWEDDGTDLYITPPLELGNHSILVKAMDRAGNYLLSSASFTVDSSFLTKYLGGKDTDGKEKTPISFWSVMRVILITMASICGIALAGFGAGYVWHKLD